MNQVLITREVVGQSVDMPDEQALDYDLTQRQQGKEPVSAVWGASANGASSELNVMSRNGRIDTYGCDIGPVCITEDNRLVLRGVAIWKDSNTL